MRRPWKYASFWCARIISGAKAKGYGEDVGDDGSELVVVVGAADVDGGEAVEVTFVDVDGAGVLDVGGAGSFAIVNSVYYVTTICGLAYLLSELLIKTEI